MQYKAIKSNLLSNGKQQFLNLAYQKAKKINKIRTKFVGIKITLER